MLGCSVLPSSWAYLVKRLLWRTWPNTRSFWKRQCSDQCSCFVVNPQVMKEWVGTDGIPADLVAFLLSRFPHLLVHGLRVDAFDSEMVAALSRGKLQSVDAIDGECPAYVIAKDSKDICGSVFGTLVWSGEFCQRSCLLRRW